MVLLVTSLALKHRVHMPGRAPTVLNNSPAFPSMIRGLKMAMHMYSTVQDLEDFSFICFVLNNLI